MKGHRNILLYPFSLLYGAITGFRNFLYNSDILHSQEFSIPVICVGNLTVGGTGKTPHCEYLINLLKDKFNVALLSRGFKRKTSGFLIANPGMSPHDIGDEPLQICRKFPVITVAVDRNRINGVKAVLQERPGTEVIILDDGFQHRKIKPGYSILLTDFSRMIIKDHMLPYGELRESLKNMDRADIIIITKTPPDISPIQRRIIVKETAMAPWQNLYFTSIGYDEPVPVFTTGSTSNNIFKSGKKEDRGILLVTGIARAEMIKEYLGKFAAEIIHLEFSDHHNFSENDISRISESFDKLLQPDKYVITTEKDAVRLREFVNIADALKSSFFYIPIGIEFFNDDRNEFDNLIIEYVRKNKRNSRIS